MYQKRGLLRSRIRDCIETVSNSKNINQTMKRAFFTFLAAISLLVATAQEKVYEIGEVGVINYGDGRKLFRQKNDEQTPLQGQHRLIDGYHSEYILASFKDGMYDGKYQHFKREALIEEANYKEGRLDGIRKEFYGDGESLKSETTFVNGKLNGVRKTYSQNGKVETEKEYKMGIEDGFDKRYHYETGELTLDTYYKEGKPYGTWVEHMMSNVGDFTRTSSYKNGLMDGKYSEIWATGKPRKVGYYKEGKKDGVWTIYRNDGQVELSTTYKTDEKNGEEIHYYTDGKIEKSTHYLNGKRDGIYRDYFNATANMKSEFTYKDGKRHGGYKRFYDTGILREEGTCDADNEVYRKEYYNTGKLKSVAERKNGSWTTLERYNQEGVKIQ